MESIEEKVRKVMEQAARARYQFVDVEMQTCATCLEMAKYQFSVGNEAFGRREIEIAERGIQEAERFSEGLAADVRAAVGERLDRLKRSVNEMKVEKVSPKLG